MAARGGTEFRLQLAGKVGYRGLNLPRHVRTFALEPLPDVVGRLRDQLLEDMPRDVLAQAKLLGEDGIAFRALDHVQEAEVGEFGAAIAGDGFHDLLVAAL